MTSVPRALARNGVHLFALSGVAIAQPLFGLLNTDPAVLVATGATGFALVLLALGIALVPPLTLLLAETVAMLVRPRVAQALHLVFVGSLAAAFVLQAHTSIGESPALVVAPVAGIGLAFLYSRSAPVRSFATVLALGPVLFVALFLLSGPSSPLVRATEPASTAAAGPGTRAPVVMLVLDELPVISLLDAERRIDADRFPAFASLARDATWFRNTASVDAFSSFAVPAILSGLRPDRDRFPHVASYPRNLFTLLEGSYTQHVEETLTHLCPVRICPEEGGSAPARAWSSAGELLDAFETRVLPDALAGPARSATRRLRRWLGARRSRSQPEAVAGVAGELFVEFGEVLSTRVDDFRRFVVGIRPSRRPVLHFIHVLLPHSPFEFVSSGRRYNQPLHGMSASLDWSPGEFAFHGWQRHLLQLEFTDRLLGELLDKLKRTGLYERALVALAADHGASFRPGTNFRDAERRTLDQVALVPFFVKRPGQRRGEVRDVPLETVDVLPTIADGLGVRLPWRTDGRSGFARGGPAREMVRMTTFGRDPASGSRAEITREQWALPNQVRLFGRRQDERSRFALGRDRALIGTRVRSGLATDASLRARFEGEGPVRKVDPDAAAVPVAVDGVIRGGARAAGRTVAILLNGRVAAVTRSWRDDGTERFTAVLPERLLRAGRNRLAAALVADEPGGPRVVRMLGA